MYDTFPTTILNLLKVETLLNTKKHAKVTFKYFVFSQNTNQIPFHTTCVTSVRVTSRPGISGNLEKSGNFVALKKSQRNVSEFCEIRKSQGILRQNWKKSGNFICAK